VRSAIPIIGETAAIRLWEQMSVLLGWSLTKMKADTLMSANECFVEKPVGFKIAKAQHIAPPSDRLKHARTLADLIWSRPKSAIQNYLDLWNWDTCDP
jgi:hypothetical protein